MAAIGTALMSGLSHTDQEKMFRPWWDNLEDFVIYGLISLGLVVLPTQIFQGTPLACTICTTVRQSQSNLSVILTLLRRNSAGLTRVSPAGLSPSITSSTSRTTALRTPSVTSLSTFLTFSSSSL